MEYWIEQLYVYVLEVKDKTSELVVSNSGIIFHEKHKINEDISVQEWIDKLQDK